MGWIVIRPSLELLQTFDEGMADGVHIRVRDMEDL